MGSPSAPTPTPPPHRPPLSCPICLSRLRHASVARCGHSFCTTCIHVYLSPSIASLPKPCPVCAAPLLAEQLYRNVALDDAVTALSPSPPRDDAAADLMLAQLLQRRLRADAGRRALGACVTLRVLERVLADKRRELHTVQQQMQLLHADIEHVRDVVAADSLASQLLHARAPPPPLRTRMSLLSRYHSDVRELYLRSAAAHFPAALNHLTDALVEATSITTVRARATIASFDILAPSHQLVSSIEFNPSASLFATAGVTKSIKLFDFDPLVSPPSPASSSPLSPHSSSEPNPGSSAQHYPILNVNTPAKISCLAWGHQPTSLLAASMYNAHILMHDTDANATVRFLTEHKSRVWYVHSSPQHPSLLISGSDDNTVRLWDTRQHTSTNVLNTNASICCVKFNNFHQHQFAFGSADHNVYSYDLRRMDVPLCVFEGHWRAVSHVLFLNRSELISASTDSSCKLWDVEKQQPGLSYTGHSNNRNFVGLSGDADFFACGSEDSAVYVYNKMFAGPVARYPFGSSGSFVSTVAWKPETKWLVAANNTGSIEILELS